MTWMIRGRIPLQRATHKNRGRQNGAGEVPGPVADPELELHNFIFIMISFPLFRVFVSGFGCGMGGAVCLARCLPLFSSAVDHVDGRNGSLIRKGRGRRVCFIAINTAALEQVLAGLLDHVFQRPRFGHVPGFGHLVQVRDAVRMESEVSGDSIRLVFGDSIRRPVDVDIHFFSPVDVSVECIHIAGILQVWIH